MIDRRTLIAAGVALGAVRGTRAAAPRDRKRQAIDAITLPPGFAGVIAYGRRGRVEHIRSVGLADVEAGTPVTSATRFRWGSASKWLVSVAVLRLAEQRVLRLQAPITDYLPDFRRDTGDRVLVRHLLSNTSGIPDLLGRQVASEPALRTSNASAASIVARFGGGDLAFAPGSGWDYSALNWVILATLLQRVTGQSVPELVGRLVLRPLGLTASGFVQADQSAMPDVAVAYSAALPPERKMSSVPPFLAASGTVASTVRDAVRAAHGIFHGALLSTRSRTALTTVHWPEQDYALGGRVHLIGGERWAWEPGKVGGYRALIAHRLARSETVVIFNTTDMDQPVIGAWAETIARA